MQPTARLRATRQLLDRDLVAAALAGTAAAFGELMRRNNQRAFRTAWSLTQDRMEAEDVVQDAYLKAFTRLGDFAERSSFSTWLLRIVVNEALMRRRHRARQIAAAGDKVQVLPAEADRPASAGDTPEAAVGRRELQGRLERAIGALPAEFRAVFMLRAVEDLTVEETAEALALNPQTVRSRLFRARLQLRRQLERELAGAFKELLPFAGSQCEALAARVIEHLTQQGRLRPPP